MTEPVAASEPDWSRSMKALMWLGKRFIKLRWWVQAIVALVPIYVAAFLIVAAGGSDPSTYKHGPGVVAGIAFAVGSTIYLPWKLRRISREYNSVAGDSDAEGNGAP